MAKIDCLIREKPVNATKEEKVRQSFLAHLIHSLEYPKSDIKIEVAIKHGSSEVLDVETKKKKRADIVIYEDGSSEDIKVIIEVKKQKEKTGEDQVKSYGNVTNARYLVWYNGSDATLTWKRVKAKSGWQWKKIGFLPHFGFEDGDYTPKKTDLDGIKDIKGLFESINSFIWVNSNIKNKKEIFLQFIYVLFTKLYDEKYNSQPKFYVLDSEYESILDKGKSKSFEDRFFSLFKELTTNPSFKDIFDEKDKIDLDQYLLGEIVYRLQYLKIGGSDIKGDAFQLFLSPYYRGENDQYLTPESVIKMTLDIIKPDIKDVVIDPACGTGRFLANTISYLRSDLDKSGFSVKEWAIEHIFGIEIDRMLSKISKIYMVLIGDGHSNIFNRNSLIKPVEEYEVSKNNITIALTNPPFGSKEKVTNKAVLEHYDLGHEWDSELVRTDSTRKTGQSQGTLMLERCLHFVGDEGIVGIVMPDGVLSNLGDKYIRKWITENCEIKAVISLPEETFRTKLIGANVKTSILVLKKKKGIQTHDIFFGVPQTIGYDFQGYQIKSNEVLDVADYYHNASSIPQDKKKQYFKMSLDNVQLIDRIDASFYSYETTFSGKYVIQDFCDVFTGKTPNKSDYLDEGSIKILKVRCLTNEVVDWSDKKRDYVTKRWYKKITVDIGVREDDILLAAAAHVAKYIGDEINVVDKVPTEYEAAIASAKINVIRVKDKKKLNPYVLLYFLRSQEGYDAIQAMVRGQTAEIYPQDIFKIKIPKKVVDLSEKEGEKIERKQKELVKTLRQSRHDLESMDSAIGLTGHKSISLNKYEYVDSEND